MSDKLKKIQGALAKKSLIDFAVWMNPDYRVEWFHRLIADRLEKFARFEITRLIITIPPRHGKALALDTPILTPDRGFVPMGDLRPGDQVFGKDGRPCNVVGRSPVWKNRKVYRVLHNRHSSSIVADEAHEWQYETCRKAKSEGIAETRHLATLSRAAKVYRAPALEVPEPATPFVDPYTLGMWLGDGSAGSGTTFHSGDQDREFVREQVAYETTDRSQANSFGVVGGFHTALGDAGLLDNKHFKDEWLLWAAEDRLALLQGLIDSDGYVPPGGNIEFCNTNHSLAAGVAQLVRSLGVRASLNEDRATLYGKDCGPRYRVLFYMKDAARLPRKAANCRNASKSNDHFLKFEPLEERQDTVCIEVDGPDHLFLAGYELVPTRNTELASRMLPAWIYGAIDPAAKILASSGEQDLANANSRDCKRLMQSPRYKQLFGDRLGGKNREDYFETNEGGYYNARSVGSGISGRGAEYFIVDDFFANRRAAESPAERDALWDWYNSDALKRLHYPASILVMATRWHHDDLIGRILDSPDADDYEVIHIPKIHDWEEDEAPEWDPREPGGPLLSPVTARAANEFFEDEPIPDRRRLDPKIVTREEVAQRVIAQAEKDKARDPYSFSSVDQGRPTPRGGGLFQESNFRYYTAPPAAIYETADQVWISVDPAYGSSNDGDPSAALVIARRDNRLYVLREVVGRFDFSELKRRLVELWHEFPRASFLIEEKASGLSLIQALRKELPRVIGFNPRPYGDKAQRAQYAADRYASEGVLHPQQRHAPWLALFEDELKKFPGSKHDDRVDALSQIVIYLDHERRGQSNMDRVLRVIEGGFTA